MLETGETSSSEHELKRNLKFRHLIMISLGGAIGTGLFLTTGATIHTAGPGGALLAYMMIGIMIFFIMTSLGEMAAYMPISGSLSAYGTRFVDPAFGLALGWNYWFNGAITLPAELSAATLIMKFWFPHSPSLLWSGMFLLIIFTINVLSVKSYGEGEYWFSFVKVATVIIFIIVGVLMIFGIMGGQAVGFKNLTIGDAPFRGGFMTVFSVMLVAAYSFQGVEMVGIASGESENPEKNIPRATRTIFWRILLFYVLAIFIIGLLIPYTNHKLLSDNVMVSPFTMIFQKAGLAFAASVMNAVILTAVLSAGNSFLYGSSRILHAMALSGQAPRFLGKVNRRGVPIYALLATTIFGILAFLSSVVGDGAIYYWLLSASSVTGFINWLGISISHYRFRKAYIAQGYSLDDLPYRAKWFPLGPIFALIVCLFVLLGQGYQEMTGGHIDWKSVISIYLSIPLFVFIWLGYKLTKKTKVIPLKECVLDPQKD
ncbi:amino acid permease [Scopulibacillus daqui]|nr:amino acid permease [Scopulibacillus daqui]